MKTLFSLLLASLLLFCEAHKGDEKVYKQINSHIEKRQYAAVSSLLDKISPAEKSSNKYLRIASLTYDSLNDYSNAITAYEKLIPSATDSAGIIVRVSFLKKEKIKADEAERVRLEQMKNCGKCKGTGYIEVSGTCEKCNGFKKVTKDCARCQGQGKTICGSCMGQGRRESKELGGVVACEKCQGVGSLECTALCNRGKVTDECNKCQGRGIEYKKVKCDQHP